MVAATGAGLSPTDVALFSCSATLSINGRRCREERAESGRLVVSLPTSLLPLVLRFRAEPRVLYGVVHCSSALPLSTEGCPELLLLVLTEMFSFSD